MDKLSNLQLLEVFNTFSKDFLHSDNYLTNTLLLLFTVAICFYIGLQILQWVVVSLATVVTNAKALGFNYLSSKEKKRAIQRKKQFSGVLRSDLDSIAKAENWNDQWFTDLEAEVEAEGSYFNNAFNKIVRKKSYGIRRVPSLINAIQTGNERCMLLVGEPGSGKSIALRHLGRELAERGERGDLKDLAPLYINLKELPQYPGKQIDADFIKDFVINHIRRGDGDTSDFVKEHWQEYKEKGIWFFLFDSFDEIPAVLHAPNGSPVLADHSRAIRQFMDGMGRCRSLLA